MKRLFDFIPSPVVMVATSYSMHDLNDIDVYICAGEIDHNNELTLSLPHGHKLCVEQKITVHLDNRTGVNEYDAALSVYRLSYKGSVKSVDDTSVVITPLEFQVFYGISIMLEYRHPGYSFPHDERQTKHLTQTALVKMPEIDKEEHENKIGVLITKACIQPHTTVMAFLSSKEDDIFFITLPGTFKSQLLKRDNQCYFAIDNRATFTFERELEWNYSIIKGSVFAIDKATPLFTDIKETFIAKNPWEVGFFSHPDIEMFHIKAQSTICPSRKK